MKARIFDVKRFAVQDGDGIRTTVFFKGCSLKCIWCHNPEGISFDRQIMYYKDKCIGCGECVKICDHGGQLMPIDGHQYNKKSCVACGNCTHGCFSQALKLCGYEVTVDELVPTLLEDKNFYEASGGGVTLSGGECLLQADFCSELLYRLQENGINTAVDTCGFVSIEQLNKVIPFTDTFLYDLKAFDEHVHIRCTGQSNKTILDNLRYLDSLGKSTEIRIPLVPDYNDSQIDKLYGFVKELRNVKKVRVLPYHNYATSKFKALGMEALMPTRLPDNDDVKRAQSLFDQIMVECH